MRILGIDPGLNTTGYGLIEAKKSSFKLIEAGVIRTSSKDRIERRLHMLYKGLSGLVNEQNPSILALEKLYTHYKHPTTALLMGHARGIICLVAGEKDVPVISYPATRIKKAVAGNGHASKGQISGMIRSLLSLKGVPQSNDITDALAVAICHAHVERI